MKIFISKPELVAAAGVCVSTERTRPYLNGVFIEPREGGGLYIVALDGHRMSVGYDDKGRFEGDATPALLDLDRPDYAKFGGKKVTCADIVDDRATLSDGTSFLVRHMDETFPDWQRVVPTGDPEITAPCFSGAYLGDFGKIARLLGSKASWFTIAGAGDRDPQVVRVANRNDWFGVLMPARGKRTGVPDWMKGAE